MQDNYGWINELRALGLDKLMPDGRILPLLLFHELIIFQR